MRVEHRTALYWRPARRAPFASLQGPRGAPRLFGPASVGKDALVASEAEPERRVRPRLHSLDNAYVVMGGGDDGVVLTERHELLAELSSFAQISLKPTPLDVQHSLRPEVLDEAVVGVDGAWRNYYHWLVNALARSRLCAEASPASATILLPDFRNDPTAPGPVKSSVLEASLDALLGGLPVRLLAPGMYRVRRLHVLWTRPHAPTDIAGMERLYEIFEAVAQRFAGRVHPRRRLFLSRKGAFDQRLPSSHRSALDTLLTRQGFETLDLAEMSFEAQVCAAAQAEIMVSPHGAGLTNLLFSPRNALVVELTSRIGVGGKYRPWYYQLCDGRDQPYAAIDVACDGWLDDLAAAIGSRPARQGCP